MVIDINNTQLKLEKGLKALDFLETNINSLSKWLTVVEQKLNEIEDNQLFEKNSEAHVFIIVRFTIIYV